MEEDIEIAIMFTVIFILIVWGIMLYFIIESDPLKDDDMPKDPDKYWEWGMWRGWRPSDEYIKDYNIHQRIEAIVDIWMVIPIGMIMLWLLYEWR